VIRLVASHQIDLRKLSTAHYKLEEMQEAMQRVMKRDVMKVLVHCSS